nr:MAG TPA: hypothetical protein [Caudoviricetes sp.]DAS38799.1 MAG TPA: hypothetical protein [Caudoviricetes sp.]DAT54408.1 MAG TPA: hypothetical protein [Caudoviricetes sp.]
MIALKGGFHKIALGALVPGAFSYPRRPHGLDHA